MNHTKYRDAQELLTIHAKTLDVKVWVIFVYKWEWEGYRSRFERILRKLAFQNLSLPIAFLKKQNFPQFNIFVVNFV